jgi:hypothetical protein
MPGKAKVLDEPLTQLLGGMQAQMPVKNPAFDPKAKILMNRKYMLELADKERQEHSSRFKEVGLNLPHGAEEEK